MREVKRVLHVLGGLQRGGAETLVMNLYRNIDRSKIQFDFVVHTDTKDAYYEEIIKMGGRIYSCPKYKVYNHFQYSKWWKNFINEHEEYSVVHGHVRSTASIYLKIARKNKRYAIAHSHSTSSGKGIKGMIKDVMQRGIRKNADFFMGCSKKANEWLFGKKVANSENKCIILKNGIDTNKFSYNKEIEDKIRKELNIEDKFVVGTVGRIETPKNPLFIVDVFKEISDKRDDAVFLWVGDGSLFSSVKEKVKQLNLEEKVVMVGAKGNVSDYLQAMNVFLFPSLWEGLGISLIEAQSVGVPCVVSNTIPNEAMVTDLVNVVNLEDDASSWASKCLEFVEGEKKITKEEILNNGYDIHGVVKTLEGIYERD